MSGMQQLLWSLALVSSFLSILFLMLYFSDLGKDTDQGKADQTRGTRWTLLGFTSGSWAGVFSSWFTPEPGLQFLIATVLGILVVLIRWAFYRLDQKRKAQFQLEEAVAHTGKVLKNIPPHRAGTGTIRLHMRSAPFELDAMTMGEQIRPGQYIRVVEIVEGRIVRVEPLPPDAPPTKARERR